MLWSSIPQRQRSRTAYGGLVLCSLPLLLSECQLDRV